MIGGGSDAESSDSEGTRPHFRPLKPGRAAKNAVADSLPAQQGRRRGRKAKDLADLAKFADSSDDELRAKLEAVREAATQAAAPASPAKEEAGREGGDEAEAAGTAVADGASGAPADAPRKKSVKQRVQDLRHRTPRKEDKEQEAGKSLSEKFQAKGARLLRKDSAAGRDVEAPRLKRARKVVAASQGAGEEFTPEGASEAATLAYLESLGYKDADGAATDPSRPAKKVLQRRAPKAKAAKAKVLAATPAGKHDGPSPGKSDEPTPEGRFRLRGQGQGKGGGKGKGKKADQSSESEPEEEQEEAWRESLRGRCDRGCTKLETAFSIKPCAAAGIRQLPPGSFLGGVPGGLPLFDRDGKVNVHFMLGAYKAAQRTSEKRRRGEESAEQQVDRSSAMYLKWLLREARQLRVVSKSEVNRGRIADKRCKAAQKSGRWSLTFATNLAAASDDDGEELADLAQQAVEVNFKGWQRSEAASKEVNKEADLVRLRHQVEHRKSAISATSSHKVDLHQMRTLLTAPSLSFDWEEKEGEESEADLEVDVPEEHRKDRRDFFKEQLHRSVSFSQAKRLTQEDRSKSFTSDQATPSSLPGQQSQQERPRRRLPRQRSQQGEQAQEQVHQQPTPQQQPETPRVEGQQPEEQEQQQDQQQEHEQPQEELQQAPPEEPEQPRKPDEQQPQLQQKEQPLPTEQAGQLQDPSELFERPQEIEQLELPEPRAEQEPEQQPAEQQPEPEQPLAAQQEPAELQQEAPELRCEMQAAEQPAAPSRKRPPRITDEEGWQGITPTAMWAADDDGFSQEPPEEDRAEQALEAAIVSPTQPMRPWAPAAGGAEAAISPTQPMQPWPAHAAADGGAGAVVSPTQPMQPWPAPAAAAELHEEISPTQPMDISFLRQQSSEISPTQPMQQPPPAAAPVPQAAGRNLDHCQTEPWDPDSQVPARERQPKEDGARHPKRSAAHLSDDSLGDDEDDSGDLDAAPNGADGSEVLEVPAAPEAPKRRQQEREWLRHKRQAAREEGLKRQRLEAAAEKARKRQEAIAKGGKATMTAEDKSRYERMVDSSGFGSKALALAARGEGLGRAVPFADEAAFTLAFGAGGGAGAKKKSFLVSR